MKRGQNAYHVWLKQLGEVQAGMWWRLGKGRFVQIGLEVLFVSGLLIFSERIFTAIEQSRFAEGLTPWMLKLSFWAVIGLLTLIPLVAIWRNLSTLAMIFTELAKERTRVSGPLVENGLKTISALGLAYWLSLIVPTESLSRWAIVIIAALLAGVLAIFSRRLIYWHSEWQTSLRGVFANKPGEQTAPSPAWVETSGGWDINLQECQLPERAACSGRTIAEIGVRARFGCSITEIYRQGHTLIAPEPTLTLYAGDRLLLLGTTEQIGVARRALGEVTPAGETAGFDEARLETVMVPAGPRTGSSMAQLQIPKHTGVLVAGHHRNGIRTINPAPSEILAEGDELLVLGAPGQIRAFKRWLSGTEIVGAQKSKAAKPAAR